MCKSSSLIFVLLFAFLFRLERPRWVLLGIILIISLGVTLMVANETDFVLIGFIQVMLSSVSSGLRWALTQIVLMTNDEKGKPHQNPVISVSRLAPIMFVCNAFVSLLLEGEGLKNSAFFASVGSTLVIVGWMIIGGFVAFLMTFFEFKAIQVIGVLSLSVAGILKVFYCFNCRKY